MPTDIDSRRLLDGQRALDVSATLPKTCAESRQQCAVIIDGIAALQSLDDLGPALNAQVFNDVKTLWERLILRQQWKEPA